MGSMHVDTSSPEFRQAAEEAETLSQKIRSANGDLEPAYQALEFAIAKFEESGYSVDALIPASGEPGLGFAMSKAKTGKGFWEIYSRAVRDKLCDSKGELNRLAKTGLPSSAGAIAATTMATLALPAAAITVVVPFAAILASVGVEAYCKWSK